MDKPTCKTCVYYEEGAGEHGLGLCHLAPTGPGNAHNAFKTMYPHQWCGQHHKFKDYLANLQFFNWASSPKQDGKQDS